MTKLFTLFLIIFSAQILLAQNNEAGTVKKIKVSEISTGGYFSLDQSILGSLNDYHKLAPNSTLLQNDFSNFSSPDQMMMKNSSTSAFSVLLGLQFAKKDRSAMNENASFRIGLNYSQRTILSSNFENERKVTYDTLNGGSASQTIIYDSIYTDSYQMNYANENLRVDLSYIYRIKPNAQLSFYTGAGITTGLTFNSKTAIRLDKKERNYSHFLNDTENVIAYKENQTVYKEEFINKSGFGISGYIPIGIDFQLSKKRDFLKHVHLFYEMRAEINYVTIPELTYYFNARSQHGFGLRILF